MYCNVVISVFLHSRLFFVFIVFKMPKQNRYIGKSGQEEAEILTEADWHHGEDTGAFHFLGQQQMKYKEGNE